MTVHDQSVCQCCNSYQDISGSLDQLGIRGQPISREVCKLFFGDLHASFSLKSFLEEAENIKHAVQVMHYPHAKRVCKEINTIEAVCGFCTPHERELSAIVAENICKELKEWFCDR